MNLIEEVRSSLESGGYRTMIGATTSSVYFEDDNLVGAVFIYTTFTELLNNWENYQDRFLGINSSVFRSDASKAWNIYTIHLTTEKAAKSEVTDGFNAEQDFRGTRKIVRSGITTKKGVKDALLPLLPLQNKSSLAFNNLGERLRERLALVSDSLIQSTSNIDTKLIANDLLEEP